MASSEPASGEGEGSQGTLPTNENENVNENARKSPSFLELNESCLVGRNRLKSRGIPKLDVKPDSNGHSWRATATSCLFDRRQPENVAKSTVAAQRAGQSSGVSFTGVSFKGVLEIPTDENEWETDSTALPPVVTGHHEVPNVHYVFLFNDTHVEYRKAAKMLLRYHRHAAFFMFDEQRTVSWYLSTAAFFFPALQSFLVKRKPQPLAPLPPICYVDVPDDAELSDYLTSFCSMNAEVPPVYTGEVSSVVATMVFCITTSLLKRRNCGLPDAWKRVEAAIDSFMLKTPGAPREILIRNLPEVRALRFLHQLLNSLSTVRALIFQGIKTSSKNAALNCSPYRWLFEALVSCPLYSVLLIKRELFDREHPFLRHSLAFEEAEKFRREARYPVPDADWPYVEFLLPDEYPIVETSFPTLEAAAIHLAMKRGHLSSPDYDRQIIARVNTNVAAKAIFSVVDEAESQLVPRTGNVVIITDPPR